MTDILTLTMNPALDISTSTGKVVPAHKLRCAEPQFHPGGGGINVARVLQRLGADCVALYPCGGTAGDRLRRMLDDEQVRSRCLPIGGDIRESFSVHEDASGAEYRFVLPGPALAEREWRAVLAAVKDWQPAPHYLVASGSLPPGVPPDFYAQLAQIAHARGTLMILDTSGAALAAALDEGVYLVKPSLRELQDLTGEPLPGEAEWLAAAQRLVRHGRSRLVALSLGPQGALLVSADQSLRAKAVAVPVASTIGAGDSFTAGLVRALSLHGGLDQALRTASAAAAAALLAPGTSLCQPADVERLMAEVEIAPA